VQGRLDEIPDATRRALAMIRLLALLGLHFLVSFVLLPDNAVVGHPIHHDDYANLAQRLDQSRGLHARPVSTFAIAAVASLGPQFAYAAQNVLLVLCVWLGLRFVELFVREGRPLPALGFVATGILAFSFPSIVDWTKYLGLLTNLTSAAFGLAAMVLMATLRLKPDHPGVREVVLVVLVALSFWAKEDFALPLLGTAAAIALSGGGRRWVGITAGIGALFAGAILYNRFVGSVFVSGMRQPDDPYFVDLSPGSLWATFARMMLETRYARSLVVLTLVVAAAAVLLARVDWRARLRIAALPVIALSVLVPYAIFPNHAFPYYAFLPVAMLAAVLPAAAYAATRSRD
jgi:hypothetical protein